jgi:hypothetical protein
LDVAGLPTACVIAQQYSSGTFVSLRFHSSQEKFGALAETLLHLPSLFLKNFESLQLRTLKCS